MLPNDNKKFWKTNLQLNSVQQHPNLELSKPLQLSSNLGEQAWLVGVTGLNGIEKLKNECHSSNPNEETMSRRKDVQICSHEPFFFWYFKVHFNVHRVPLWHLVS